eukprot:scaffold106809_cov42-Prasinocladus_malaysianus.AAC.1
MPDLQCTSLLLQDTRNESKRPVLCRVCRVIETRVRVATTRTRTCPHQGKASHGTSTVPVSACIHASLPRAAAGTDITDTRTRTSTFILAYYRGFRPDDQQEQNQSEAWI